EVALHRQCRVFVVIMERREKDAAAQVKIGHVMLPQGIMDWAGGPSLSQSSAIPPGSRKRFPGAAGLHASRTAAGLASFPQEAKSEPSDSSGIGRRNGTYTVQKDSRDCRRGSVREVLDVA